MEITGEYLKISFSSCFGVLNVFFFFKLLMGFIPRVSRPYRVNEIAAVAFIIIICTFQKPLHVYLILLLLSSGLYCKVSFPFKEEHS